jgi:hypothetical protein
MSRAALPRPMPAMRLRAAAASAPGGASSLLRLSAPARLPSGAMLGHWAGRAARALHADEPGLVLTPAAV